MESTATQLLTRRDAPGQRGFREQGGAAPSPGRRSSRCVCTHAINSKRPYMYVTPAAPAPRLPAHPPSRQNTPVLAPAPRKSARRNHVRVVRNGMRCNVAAPETERGPRSQTARVWTNRVTPGGTFLARPLTRHRAKTTRAQADNAQWEDRSGPPSFTALESALAYARPVLCARARPHAHP
eukprot:scaffold478_cov409-Prasinococcus_capsulatus_cf.AAC.17